LARLDGREAGVAPDGVSLGVPVAMAASGVTLMGHATDGGGATPDGRGPAAVSRSGARDQAWKAPVPLGVP
jgi:hypothetical protein